MCWMAKTIPEPHLWNLCTNFLPSVTFQFFRSLLENWWFFLWCINIRALKSEIVNMWFSAFISQIIFTIIIFISFHLWEYNHHTAIWCRSCTIKKVPFKCSTNNKNYKSNKNISVLKTNCSVSKSKLFVPFF